MTTSEPTPKTSLEDPNAQSFYVVKQDDKGFTDEQIAKWLSGEPLDVVTAAVNAFHLPGKHNQLDHGHVGNNHGGTGGDKQSSIDASEMTNRRAQFDERIKDAYTGDEVFTRGSQYASLEDFTQAYENERGEGDPTASRVESSYGMYQVSYEEINTELRNDNLDDFNERVVNYMNTGFKHSSTTSDVVVHRGIGNAKHLFGDAWNDEGDNSGLSWDDPAYMSTTTSAIVARSYATNDLIKRDGVMMRMLVKRGTPAMSMRGNLSQLLLGPDRTATVIRDYIGDDDGFRTIDVEVS
jgi:hypothetical protein